MNNTTENDTRSPLCDFSSTQAIFDAFLYILIAVVAIIGNVIVFLCYYRFRSLRTVTNVFILALSASDIFVSVLSIPYSFSVMLCGVQISTNQQLSEVVYLICDMLPSILSIHYLTLVAVDRALAISKPFLHRKYVNRSRAWVSIAVIWCYTAFLVSIMFTMNSVNFTMFIIAVGYFVPVATMIICYSIMGYIAKRHAHELSLLDRTAKRLRKENDANKNSTFKNGSNNNGSLETKVEAQHFLVPENKRSNSIWADLNIGKKIRNMSLIPGKRSSEGSIHGEKHLRRELKAAFTLSFILSCFILSWTPFIGLNLEYFRCPDCPIKPNLIKYFKMLHYLNSAVNPILYVLLNKHWRSAFRRILCGVPPQTVSDGTQSEVFGW